MAMTAFPLTKHLTLAAPSSSVNSRATPTLKNHQLHHLDPSTISTTLQSFRATQNVNTNKNFKLEVLMSLRAMASAMTMEPSLMTKKKRSQVLNREVVFQKGVKDL